MNDFEWFRDHHTENIERMFAAVGDLYAEFWNDFFHFAIFDQPDDSWDDAFLRTHRFYAGALGIGPGGTALELACGRGGFANFLARETGAEVLGIDLSRAQLRRARRHKQPNLQFLHHDIMAVHELDQTFDAVVLMDADIYLPDKRLAIERISRTMNPGARFLLIAWCKQEGLNSLQEEVVLHPFMRYWGAPSLESASGYNKHFAAAGLRIVDQIDLNDKVARNWETGYRRAIKAAQELSTAKAASYAWKSLRQGKESLRLIKEQFPAALYIKAAFDAGFLRYTYLLAEKEGQALH
ncbi:methyltransferase domain-containing protein [Proteobacteria bacterium 005FR1]|nr:methyltransferase domain-containing protein [Proteobacteria bacterium 005FR1]